MSKFFRKIVNYVRSVYPITFIQNRPYCNLKKITGNKIYFSCRGSGSLLHIKFDDIINDHAVLSDFSSEQASYIGYCYGEYWEELTKKNQSIDRCDFFIINSQKKYSIYSTDRRNNLLFLDKDTQEIHTLPLLTIFNNKELIKGFDPTQAFYIGFLSKKYEKRIYRNQPKVSTNKITLVK